MPDSPRVGQSGGESPEKMSGWTRQSTPNTNEVKKVVANFSTPFGFDAGAPGSGGALDPELLGVHHMIAAYHNTMGLLIVALMAALIYLDYRLLGTYASSLAAASLCGVALHQPKQVLARWLEFEGPAEALPQGLSATPREAAQRLLTRTGELVALAWQPKNAEWNYWRYVVVGYGVYALRQTWSVGLALFLGLAGVLAWTLWSLWDSSFVGMLAMPVNWLRKRASVHRNSIATAVVLAGTFVFALSSSLFITYRVAGELDGLRRMTVDAASQQKEGRALEQLSEFVGMNRSELTSHIHNATKSATEYVANYSRELVGDPDLAHELERLMTTIVSEFSGNSSGNSSASPWQAVIETVRSSPEGYTRASSLLQSIAGHAFSLVGLLLRLMMLSVDYLFSMTLFASWLFAFVNSDTDFFAGIVSNMIIGANTANNTYRVLQNSVQGVLGGLAHGIFFHASLTWLIYSLLGVPFLYIGSALAGLMSIVPLVSPWLVILLPGGIRYCLDLWVVEGEFFCWLILALVWAFGGSSSISTASLQKDHLLPPSVAGQSLLLAYYAFGTSGVVTGPLIVAATAGCLAVFKESVLLRIRSFSQKAAKELEQDASDGELKMDLSEDAAPDESTPLRRRRTSSMSRKKLA